MAENEEIKKDAEMSADAEAESAADTEGHTEEINAEKPQTQAAAPKKEKKPRRKFNSKKLKHGSLSVVFTVLFIAAVVLVNVILNLVLDRFNVEADLTAGNVFTLGEETKQYITDVKDEVTLYVTAEEDTLRSSGETLYEQIAEFLERMSALNGNIKVQYVNLLTDPDFSNKFVEDLKNYQIIVQSGKTGRYRILNINDFLRFKLSDGNTYSYSEANMYVSYAGYTVEDYFSNAEEQIVSAMMSVTKEDPTVVTFLTGYAESDSSALESILTANAYDVRSAEIDRIEKIPEETDILVMHGPTKDYSLEAITKIDEWLANEGEYGKSLIYIATPEASETPHLDEYLKEWGLEIGRGYIIQFNTDHAYSTGSPIPLMQDLEMVADTDYYKNMRVSAGSNFIGYYVRPVIKLWEENKIYTSTTVARAYGEECLLYPFDADESWKPSEADLKGYDVIVESGKVTFGDDNKPVFSKVIAAGSDQLFTEYFTTASNYSNGEAALSLFDTNSDAEKNEIKIVEKSFKAETYQLDSGTQTGIGIVFAIIIPVIIIIAGIIVWIKRRRL